MRKDEALLNHILHHGRTGLLIAFACALPGGADDTGPLRLTPEIAVHYAMERNEALGMARSDAQSAEARVRETRADGLPDLAASVDYTRNWLLPSIVFNDAAVKIGNDNQVAGALRLTQPLYTGGRVHGSLQSARAQATAAGQSERQVRQSIRAQVETSLYDYLLAADMANVRDLALDRARSNQRQVQALRAAGRATRFEETRAGVQVASAESDSIESANALALALIDLKDVVGLDLARTVVVDVGYRDASKLDLDEGPEALVAEALRRRPEERQLQAVAEGYAGAERAAGAGTKPQVDLVAAGQMQFQDDSFSGIGDTDEWRRNWSTGVSVRVPLFDGMRTRARVAQAREARRRVQLQSERLARSIEREVRRAWMDVDEAEQRLRARQGSVEQARLGLDDAEARYRSGTGTQLEVLDAQLSLLQAESESARARRDRAVALVELERAVGVLGEDVAAD